MTKLLLLKLIICISIVSSFGQKKEVEIAYKDGIKAIYECNDGILNGKYQSYYSNGQKCAEGNFKDNFRIGKWSVWDSEGKEQVKRFYESPFVYKSISPKTPKSPLIDSLNVTQYEPSRNEEGFMDYHLVTSDQVFYERHLWRYLPKGGENSLWSTEVFECVHSKVLKKEIQPYRNDMFSHELDEVVKKYLSQAENFTFLGFKINEVYFFDTDRFLSESRIQAICPVVLDKETKDTVDLYWISYQEIRPFLAKMLLKTKMKNKNIQNCEDIFFFRYFSSYIYMSSKSAHPLERETLAPVASKQGFEAIKADKVEINHIEFEHACWLNFSRND